MEPPVMDTMDMEIASFAEENHTLRQKGKQLKYRVENRGAHLKAQIKRTRGFKARIDAALAIYDNRPAGDQTYVGQQMAQALRGDK